MRKKILGLALATCVALAACAGFGIAQVNAASKSGSTASATDTDGNGITDNGFVYSVNSGGTAVITGIDKTLFTGTGALAIPDSIVDASAGAASSGSTSGSGKSTGTASGTTYKVTDIGNYAFAQMGGITSVTLPTGVLTVGEKAFFQCIRLTSVSIPATVNYIGDQAFGQCDALNSITVAAGNNYYIVDGGALFEYSGGFYKLIQYPTGNSATTYTPGSIVSNRLTAVGNGAFAGAYFLDTVALPATVTEIGSYAFYNCSSLSSMQLPVSVVSIMESAFENCTSLKVVTPSEKLTTIGNNAFKNCPLLTDAELGESVTSIGTAAFYGCTSLKSVVFPHSTTSIGDMAYYGDSSLAKAVIPASVTYIGSAAFSGTPVTLYTHANSTAYKYANTNALPVVETYTVSFYSDGGSLLSSQEVIVGTAAEAPAMAEREGFTLKWSTSFSNITADTVVTASWIRTYKITFSDPFNNRVEVVPVEPYQSAVAPKWTMDGYTLSWDVSEGNYRNASKDATVYAEWTDASTGFMINKDTVKPAPKGTLITRESYTYKVTSANVQDPCVALVSFADDEATVARIPATVKEEGVTYKVTVIAASSFENKTALTQVAIGENVKKIGINAFNGCTALKLLRIKSKKITKIGDNAFFGIKNKSTVYTFASKQSAYKKLLSVSGLKKKAAFVYKTF
ncbi:MAG: leucine-rich repeat domain-containing protein [Lachnospiraceae bacterium]|nr:leucine-rich repeat domain-containing protein [Lachnospiraceae bacterium]